jgi:hypothetical protein
VGKYLINLLLTIRHCSTIVLSCLRRPLLKIRSLKLLFNNFYATIDLWLNVVAAAMLHLSAQRSESASDPEAVLGYKQRTGFRIPQSRSLCRIIIALHFSNLAFERLSNPLILHDLFQFMFLFCWYFVSNSEQQLLELNLNTVTDSSSSSSNAPTCQRPANSFQVQ